jgi:hypothetical protein
MPAILQPFYKIKGFRAHISEDPYLPCQLICEVSHGNSRKSILAVDTLENIANASFPDLKTLDIRPQWDDYVLKKQAEIHVWLEEIGVHSEQEKSKWTHYY